MRTETGVMGKKFDKEATVFARVKNEEKPVTDQSTCVISYYAEGHNGLGRGPQGPQFYCLVAI